jgi:hypothetical protein
MTPTPDATIDAATDTAAPLTTERIAAILDKIDMQLDVGYPLGVEEVQPLYSMAEQLIGRNAALRDRLAAAEERERLMECDMSDLREECEAVEARIVEMQKVCNEVFGAILRSDWKGKDARKALIMLETTLRAAPTDGAARAGDADDKGEVDAQG